MLIYIQMIETEDERSKFKMIYEGYRGLMFYVANDILHNEYDAEDAVHCAFLSILRNLHKISDINSSETKAYIMIITERKAIDMIRSRKHEVSIEHSEAIAGMKVSLPGDHGLADAMAKLVPQYREVLLLRYDHGYSTREIGNMLGKSQSAVRKLLWRAKESLRSKLDEGGVEI